MKFNPEEIRLCKQVAEKHRRKIGYGDWFYSEHLKEVLLQSPFINIVRDLEIVDRDKNSIPLWTISNCFDFLGERGLWIIGVQQDEDEWSVGFAETDDLGMRTIESTHKWTDGNTPLEACLKAVLAVLEEAK